MDVSIYTKETVLQPESGTAEAYVDGIFDFKLAEDGGVITGAQTVEGTAELKQQAVIASLKQKGSDPLALEDGVQWAQSIIGETAVSVIMSQIQTAVYSVSTSLSVSFTIDSEGNLGYYIEVTV